MPVTCRSRTALRNLEILSAAEIQTDGPDVKRERLNTSVNQWVPDSRQSAEMVVMIKVSCIPKSVISSTMSQTGSESYAIRGGQRIRVNRLNICLGRLCMNLEQRSQFIVALDLPVRFRTPNAQEGLGREQRFVRA